MWVNDPAPAMTASTVTGSASATASRRRPALTSRLAGRPARVPPAAVVPGRGCPGACGVVHADLPPARAAGPGTPLTAVRRHQGGRAPASGRPRNSLHLQKSGFWGPFFSRPEIGAGGPGRRFCCGESVKMSAGPACLSTACPQRSLACPRVTATGANVQLRRRGRRKGQAPCPVLPGGRSVRLGRRLAWAILAPLAKAGLGCCGLRRPAVRRRPVASGHGLRQAHRRLAGAQG
jgi:hypothetical protein